MSGTFSAITLSGSDNTIFGRQFQNLNEYFPGTLDEMRIYTGALSGAQVAALAAIPEPAATAALVGGAMFFVARVSRRRGAA